MRHTFMNVQLYDLPSGVESLVEPYEVTQEDLRRAALDLGGGKAFVKSPEKVDA
jgi:hypothetical protein